MGLDGVELVMAWEESFSISIADSEAYILRTPRMATDLICEKLGAQDDQPGVCLTQRAFYRLRLAFTSALACSRGAVTPRTPLANLVPWKNRRAFWQSLAIYAGVPSLPTGCLGFLPPGYNDAGDLARHLVARHPRYLLEDGATWTRAQVRQTVRAIISDQLGIPEFSDDADFIYDLRID